MQNEASGEQRVSFIASVPLSENGWRPMAEGRIYTTQTIRPAFAIGICLNLGFVLDEAFYGWQVFYLALLEDSGHKRLHG